MLILLAAVVSAAVSAQNPPVVNSSPINGITAAICVLNPRMFVADDQSLCFYYVCSTAADGSYRLVPRRCGLETLVPRAFVDGLYNPCTQRFPNMSMYACIREIMDCATKLNCTNGEKVQQEGDLCWCPGSMCNAKKSTPPPPDDTVCPDGAPLKDWCALSADKPPCKNGGICINRCTNFMCNCTVPNVKDKVCNLYQI